MVVDGVKYTSIHLQHRLRYQYPYLLSPLILKVEAVSLLSNASPDFFQPAQHLQTPASIGSNL